MLTIVYDLLILMFVVWPTHTGSFIKLMDCRAETAVGI